MTRLAMIMGSLALLTTIGLVPVEAQFYSCFECESVETPDPQGPYDWTITFGDACTGGGSDAQLASTGAGEDDPEACKRCYGTSEYCGEGITFDSPLDYCEEAYDCGLSEHDLRQALFAAEVGDLDEFSAITAGHRVVATDEGVAALGCHGGISAFSQASERVRSFVASLTR